MWLKSYKEKSSDCIIHERELLNVSLRTIFKIANGMILNKIVYRNLEFVSDIK